MPREAGETAPLIFTAFGYNLMNANPFNGPQESLPLFVYRFVREPLPSDISRGFAGALVLMVLILLLFVIARIIGRDRASGPRRHLFKRAGSGRKEPGTMRRLTSPGAAPAPEGSP